MKQFTLYLLLAFTCLTLSASTPRKQVINNFDRSASNHYAYPYGTDVEIPELTPTPAGYEPFHIDHYGRMVPRPAHGTIRLEQPTSSGQVILTAMTRLFDHIVDDRLLVRRINVAACQVVDEAQAQGHHGPEQLELFVDYHAQEKEQARVQAEWDKERRCQEAMLTIRHRLGKNALLKGMNLEAGATTRERNQQIGGHKA